MEDNYFVSYVLSAVYRFTGSPTASGSEYYILNTVVSAAGLNITAAAPVSVRNIASDAISPTANADGRYIGNASLTSLVMQVLE
jgi:hypothetical protein